MSVGLHSVSGLQWRDNMLTLLHAQAIGTQEGFENASKGFVLGLFHILTEWSFGLEDEEGKSNLLKRSSTLIFIKFKAK